MGFWAALNPLEAIKTIVSPIGTMIEGWQARKTAKLENDLAIANAATQAKIEMLKTGQAADIAWENTALQNAGIKDEVMMTVVLAPMVACFIPGGAEYVRAGFEAMNASLPSYWEYAFYCTIAVSYGIRKFTDMKSIAAGASPLTMAMSLLGGSSSESPKQNDNN